MHKEAGVPARLALVGISGSGKTTTGKSMAAVMGMPFVDLDQRVERVAGYSVEEIFASLGEPAFRCLEEEALEQVSRETGPLILSTGGGVILNEASRSTLKSAFFVVWLDVKPAIAARRLRGTVTRPLLGENLAADLRRLRGERKDLYAEVADSRVKIGPGEACEETVRRLLSVLPPAFEREK